ACFIYRYIFRNYFIPDSICSDIVTEINNNNNIGKCLDIIDFKDNYFIYLYKWKYYDDYKFVNVILYNARLLGNRGIVVTYNNKISEELSPKNFL
ncbi:hypothetical protein, partial [Methylacidiphilum kamchatkense]|uniref:hypothetical protein n=1 Tax=Methylacidiphilum kamchatkense TaxID=431057 RepID=UPI000584FEEA